MTRYYFERVKIPYIAFVFSRLTMVWQEYCVLPSDICSAGSTGSSDYGSTGDGPTCDGATTCAFQQRTLSSSAGSLWSCLPDEYGPAPLSKPTNSAKLCRGNSFSHPTEIRWSWLSTATSPSTRTHGTANASGEWSTRKDVMPSSFHLPPPPQPLHDF